MGASYTTVQLERAVSDSRCWSDLFRRLGLTVHASTYRSVRREVSRLNLGTEHFIGRSASSRPSTRKKCPEEILVALPPNSPRVQGGRLRGAMVSMGVPDICAGCRLVEWQGQKLPLQVDHING